MSTTSPTHFPLISLFGKTDAGLYLSDIELWGQDLSYQQAGITRKIQIADIASIEYSATCDILFVVLFYSLTVGQSITFNTSSGQPLLTIPLPNIKTQNLHNFFKQLLNQKGDIQLDPVLSEFVATGSVTPLNRAFFWAAVNSNYTRFTFGLIFLLIAIIFLFQ